MEQLRTAALALDHLLLRLVVGGHQHEAALGALALAGKVHLKLLLLLLLSCLLHHYRVGVGVADDNFAIILHFLFTLLLKRRVMLLFNIILVTIE